MNKLLKTILLTALALIAFAANSVICKMALGEELIDAPAFTIVRLLSGAIVLLFILLITKNKSASNQKGSWFSSAMLFLYAISFSFAYNSLDTGTGALILFGAVQISMVTISLFNGNKLDLREWIGMIISFIGFVYLILPGVTAPSPIGFVLMALAGTAWGIYTLQGKKSKDPLRDTAFNFIRTIPFLIVLLFFVYQKISFSYDGIWLAIISGGITSGIGYTIWYIALRGLTSTQAAVVQLLVPIIAAFGGVLFVSEKITSRLSWSSLMILGGIIIIIYYKKKLERNG